MIIGDGGVGKTAITLQFIMNKFVEEYDPTIEDDYSKQVQYDGKDFMVDIFDTAGCEEFHAARMEAYKNAMGFIVVYDVTSKHSFEALEAYIGRIQGEAQPAARAMAVVVGNKVDRADDRQITTESGAQFASRFHLDFLETSAKTRRNIDILFENILKKIAHNLVPMPPPSPRKSICLIL